MQVPQLDVGKLVGAASAPVALIIATSIFLGNLGGKYAAMMAVFRDLTHQLRESDEGRTARRRSLEGQISLYSRRLRGLVRATFWLNLSIQSFILTVLFTSVGVVYPKSHVWTWITGAFGLLGLLLLGYSGAIEMLENHYAHEELTLETSDCTGLAGDREEEEMTTLFAGAVGGEAQPASSDGHRR